MSEYNISNSQIEVSACLSMFQVEQIRMIGMLLIVAVKMKHIPFIRNKRTSFTRTGFWGFVVR